MEGHFTNFIVNKYGVPLFLRLMPQAWRLLPPSPSLVRFCTTVAGSVCSTGHSSRADCKAESAVSSNPALVRR